MPDIGVEKQKIGIHLECKRLVYGMLSQQCEHAIHAYCVVLGFKFKKLYAQNLGAEMAYFVS